MSSIPVWDIPPENSELPPTGLRIRDGAYAVGIYIGAQIAAALLMVFVVALYTGLLHGKEAAVAESQSLAQSSAFLIATIVAAVVLVFFFARHLARRSGRGWPVLGILRPANYWFAIAVAVLLGCNVLSYIFNLIAGPEVSKAAGLTMEVFANVGPVALWPMIALICVIVPITEEVVFRAILFRSLATRLPVWAAGTVSVAIFSFVHAQYLMSGWAVALLMMAQVGILGAALTWLYYKSGSLWPSVTVHVLNNSWVMVVLLLWPDSGL
ncbi:MAG: CPBP family glutamic-type intramembrane protease [Pseudomonadota bacterium]